MNLREEEVFIINFIIRRHFLLWGFGNRKEWQGKSDWSRRKLYLAEKNQ